MMNGNITYGDEANGEHLTGNTSFSLPGNVAIPNKPISDIESFKSTVNYNHTSYRSNGYTGSVFVQDWARVVPKKYAGNYYLYNNYEGRNNWTLYWTNWRESYSEKQADVWNTFKLCQQENDGIAGSGTAHSFFINSLDGYYVDPDISFSYIPYIAKNAPGSNQYGLGGTQGNIADFANDINNWFYNRLMMEGVNNITGPLNLVILDRVLDGTNGGNYLPQVIINNNFMFPLVMKESSDASYSNGGSVIE